MIILRICILAPEFLPVWGGVGTHIVELVKHLPKNIEIHIVTAARYGFGDDCLSSLDYDYSKILPGNVKIHFIGNAKDTFFYNAAFQYNCLKYVPQIVKNCRIDILLSHTAHMPDLLLMFRNLKLPIVTTIHTTIKSQRLGTIRSGRNMSCLENSEKATWLLYPILRLMEEIYFRKRDFYITPSQWMKKWFQENHTLSGNITVIPNSIDTDEYNPITNFELNEIVPRNLRNRRAILFAGRLIALKGVDTLIKAIPHIVKEVDKEELLFIFAGPGKTDKYLAEVKKIGLESCCLFTGPLHRESVKKLMHFAEIIVAPSLIENMPYTVIEAMACGKAVIASDVGGMSEIISNNVNGVLVPIHSKVALAESCTRLLEDKTMINYLGKKARKTVLENLSWSTNVRKHVDCYNYAIDNFSKMSNY